MNQIPPPPGDVLRELPESDLPPGRHRLLKEHLMTEIRHSGEAPAQTRVRWLRPTLTAASVATVAAVAFTLLPSSGGVTAPPALTSAAVLEDAALAAEHTGGPGTVRGDQFVYVESQVLSRKDASAGKRGGPAAHRVESWVSVDGSRPGLTRRPGVGDLRTPGLRPGNPLYYSFPGYDHMKSLPADPDGMYRWLRTPRRGLTAVVFPHGLIVPLHDEDQVLYVAGEAFANAIVPPEQSAALYRAVARVPGITVVEDAVDAIGRRGVGVTRQGTGAPIRTEWILDAKTYTFLGQRVTLTEDSHGMKKGTVLSDTAVLRRAVVDKAGDRP
ncbi:CU044_5270 family protein [Streptomyces sp. NPDC000658]|uniref:CU044_5270 family protein n=1 Tax=Streptomyces sp. NPDC000658 TaxID=3154266 RepID=UPI003318978F